MRILYTVYKDTDKEFTGNLDEIAKHFGINYITLLRRIKSGMTPEEAIEKPVLDKEIKIITVYKGTDKEFTGNLKEITDHFRINYNSFFSRIKSGMTPEEAIEKPVLDREIKIITIYKGTDKEFTGNLKEIADHFGINYSTFKSRIKSAMTPEEAIEKPVVDSSIKITTVYKGSDKEFTGDLKEIAKHFEINYGTFQRRIKSGMTPEEAIEKPIVDPSIKITVYKNTGKEFTGNLGKIAKHFGTSYNILLNRIKYGMTPEEAIEVPIVRVRQNNLIYKGKTGSLKELCELFNKNYTEVYNFLKYNHTLEYAMENAKNSYEEDENKY